MARRCEKFDNFTEELYFNIGINMGEVNWKEGRKEGRVVSTGEWKIGGTERSGGNHI